MFAFDGFKGARGLATREECDAMRAKGYTDQELRDAGLVSEKNGRIYDRFRNRLMFPIIDVRGNVIGFGGRVLDDSKPKYINTEGTLAFSKSRNLFAMNLAKKSKGERLILAEGYMDVIALHQAGFTQAVASLGTALTENRCPDAGAVHDTIGNNTGKIKHSY